MKASTLLILVIAVSCSRPVVAGRNNHNIDDEPQWGVTKSSLRGVVLPSSDCKIADSSDTTVFARRSMKDCNDDGADTVKSATAGEITAIIDKNSAKVNEPVLADIFVRARENAEYEVVLLPENGNTVICGPDRFSGKGPAHFRTSVKGPCPGSYGFRVIVTWALPK